MKPKHVAAAGLSLILWVGEYDMTVPELQAAAAEWLTRFSFEPA